MSSVDDEQWRKESVWTLNSTSSVQNGILPFSPFPLAPGCSDASSNLLSGPAPTNFTSTALASPNATLRLSGNYFTGSPVPYSAGVPFCPTRLQGQYYTDFLSPFFWGGGDQADSYSTNCFNSTVDYDWGGGGDGDGERCTVGPQRDATACTRFCNARSPKGPCNGLGVCTGAVCLCSQGSVPITVKSPVPPRVTYPTCSKEPSLGTPPVCCGTLGLPCMPYPLLYLRLTTVPAKLWELAPR